MYHSACIIGPLERSIRGRDDARPRGGKGDDARDKITAPIESGGRISEICEIHAGIQQQFLTSNFPSIPNSSFICFCILVTSLFNIVLDMAGRLRLQNKVAIVTGAGSCVFILSLLPRHRWLDFCCGRSLTRNMRLLLASRDI